LLRQRHIIPRHQYIIDVLFGDDVPDRKLEVSLALPAPALATSASLCYARPAFKKAYADQMAHFAAAD
jgi:hypothetical protein